jgi:hypothetical protein
MTDLSLFSNEQIAALLAALPDPAFILTRSGRYAAIFGGTDSRYYHDGSSLIGKSLHDVLNPEKAGWFGEQIAVALTWIVSFGPKRPDRIAFDSGFSICCWIARFSGRAPYTGSKPASAIFCRAASLRSSVISILARRCSRLRSWILAIAPMFFSSSAWNTTISSMRLMNSGRKCRAPRPSPPA